MISGFYVERLAEYETLRKVAQFHHLRRVRVFLLQFFQRVVDPKQSVIVGRDRSEPSKAFQT